MRVLYLANSAQIGGGNRYLQGLWNGIRNYGVEPLAVCPTDGPMVELCRNIGVPVEVLQYPQPSWRYPIKAVQGYLLWQQLLKRTKPDLIHANDFINARSVSLSAKRFALPLVCHIQFHTEPSFLRWVFRTLPKPGAFIHISRAVHGVCGPTLAQVCPGSKQFLIYNCVSTERFFPVKSNNERRHPLRIGIIANLIPIKGHMDFLEMAKMLAYRHVEAEYWIIGEDIHQSGFREQLEARCTELGLGECVKFFGHQSDVLNFLQRLDILVCASHVEPFGISLIEAMACEVPVIGTRVDGVTEVIDDGVTGYLVAPHTPREIADKVELLLADPALRKCMGKAGRNRVQRLFSQDENVKKILEVYDCLTVRKDAAS
jgi:glycosyltransferase involved in cell wall biosynthesis